MKGIWGSVRGLVAAASVIVVSMSFVPAAFGAGTAGTVECSGPQFSAAPDFGPDKTYDLDLYSDCTVTIPAGDAMPVLHKLMIERTLHATAVNAGPTGETDDGMPGEYYDITESSGDPNGDSMSIRSDVHLATDGRTKLVYSKDSKKIEATGESKHLKMFNEYLSAQSPAENGGTLTIRYGHTVHISKPGYAPTGIFTNRAKKDVTSDLIESRDEIMSGLRAAP